MPYYRPPLSEIVQRVAADFDSRLPGHKGRLRRSVIRVFILVFAGIAHGLYGFIDYLSKQILYISAEGDYLKRHAIGYLTVPFIPASFAVGPVIFSGTNGKVIPAKTVLTRDDQVTYITRADATIVGGTATATVDVVTSGQIGNMEAGDTLTLASPVDGINATATVGDAGIEGGEDAESDDSIRTRLQDRWTEPPQGGADYDYAAWTKLINGNTRVWVSPGELGARSVVVRFMRDNDPDPVPGVGNVNSTQILLNAMRPVASKPLAVAPVAQAFDYTLKLAPDSAATRAAATAAIGAFIKREATPKCTYRIQGINHDGGTLDLSRLNEAISLADGEFSHVLVSPTGESVTADAGKIYELGAGSFV